MLIIHGWSDTSESFHNLANFLKSHGFQTIELWLADYISMDDDVRVSDVGKRMSQVIIDMTNSKQLAETFDGIVKLTFLESKNPKSMKLFM